MIDARRIARTRTSAELQVCRPLRATKGRSCEYRLAS